MYQAKHPISIVTRIWNQKFLHRKSTVKYHKQQLHQTHIFIMTYSYKKLNKNYNKQEIEKLTKTERHQEFKWFHGRLFNPDLVHRRNNIQSQTGFDYLYSISMKQYKNICFQKY